MPIPATTSSDVLLRTLLDKQVDDYDAWISVEELARSIPDLDVHFENFLGPVQGNAEYLQKHMLVELQPDKLRVRLTSLGVYTALLFEIVPEEVPTSGGS